MALRPARVNAERTVWIAFALAMGADTLTEVLGLTGSSGLAGTASSTVGAVTFVLAAIALLMRMRVRLERLRPIAGMDGMIGAIAAQTVLALLILGPAAHRYAQAGHSEFAAVLMYPFADVLFLGFVAAATAEIGWRLSGWMVIALGLLLMTIGDSIAAAHAVHSAAWSPALASGFWVAAVWSLALSAWIPVPGPSDHRTDQHPAVPVAFSAVMLTLLLICTLVPGTWKATILLAGIGTVIVTVRFGMTLRQNAKLLETARAAATTDVLTGLSNRRQLDGDLETLMRACRRDGSGALVMFDLNGFKAYNDAFGHPAGDELLAALARRLVSAIGKSAAAYRLGGDEFCVMIRPGGDVKTVVARATQALTVTVNEQIITTSGGLALLPQDASTPAEALRIADLRMYEHKYRGRGARTPKRLPATERLPVPERVTQTLEYEFQLERTEA
jgi:diguanylate cyclase (GGDEF)-like protein